MIAVHNGRLALRRNREYDPFADIYNRFWDTEYRAAAMPVIRQLLCSRLKPGNSVLDVCCGTGQFAEELIEGGFRVTGIDASARMIAYARKNARTGIFHVADVRNFNLQQKFHGALCVFESLNHVPDGEGLGLAFQAIRKHLRPRAPFLFDLVGPATYRINWNATHAIVEDDIVCGIRMKYDAGAGVGTCEIAVVEDRGDGWQRRDFTVRQHCHANAVVDDALRKAGFRDVTAYAARDLGMPTSLGVDRMFRLAFA